MFASVRKRVNKQTKPRMSEKLFAVRCWLLLSSLMCARVRKHCVNKTLENRFKPLQSDVKENEKQSDEKRSLFSLSLTVCLHSPLFHSLSLSLTVSLCRMQSSYLRPVLCPIFYHLICSFHSAFKSTSLLMEVWLSPKHINSIRVQVEVI